MCKYGHDTILANFRNEMNELMTDFIVHAFHRRVHAQEFTGSNQSERLWGVRGFHGRSLVCFLPRMPRLRYI